MELTGQVYVCLTQLNLRAGKLAEHGGITMGIEWGYVSGVMVLVGQALKEQWGITARHCLGSVVRK